MFLYHRLILSISAFVLYVDSVYLCFCSICCFCLSVFLYPRVYCLSVFLYHIFSDYLESVYLCFVSKVVSLYLCFCTTECFCLSEFL